MARLHSAAQPSERGGPPAKEDSCPAQETNPPHKRLGDADGSRPATAAKIEEAANAEERTILSETPMSVSGGPANAPMGGGSSDP
eukprot:4620803-Pyramimonas_sp.AAC.1